MRTVVIVQARMTSTRLPGKIIKQVLGKPLLAYQIERLRRIPHIDEIVIATTTNDRDQAVVNLCVELDVACFRGSEEDVLARYYGAAIQFQADIVVRITADCPIIDPTICGQAINFLLKNNDQYDYVRLEQYPRGLDTEVFTFAALEECWREATAKPDREHVTPFIYRHPERYRIKRLFCPADYSHHRWTVDTPADFELIRSIIEEMYPGNPEFTMQDTLAILKKYPDWFFLNSTVHQKEYGE
ncbi:MAG: acylneuraminate cytidylyltransferase [Sporomusa sp.]|jgi:spore coat polysaccharide biosynthesis protein SpsF|nr:acylneuraminate cytidylyltransferase [Sporomusa sp.]